MNNPLITFALISYNQEKYIFDALQGAFSQTYQPLEIIISDDNSFDTTYKIIRKKIEKYNGPHKIIINRNEENLGLIGNINKVMEMAKGKYIVIAAGDDISLPERVGKICAIFKSDKKIKLVFSNMQVIDEMDNKSGMWNKSKALSKVTLENLINSNAWIYGCSNSWNRELYEIFGPMDLNVSDEGQVLAFRAAILGDVHYIPEPLILYRRHSNNTWFDKLQTDSYKVFLHNLINLNENIIGIHKNWLRDYETACKVSKCKVIDNLNEQITAKLGDADFTIKMLRTNLLNRIILVLQYFSNTKKKSAIYRVSIKYLLPYLYYIFYKNIKINK